MSGQLLLSREEIAARLSGSPEERAALIRAGARAGVAEAQTVWGQMLLDRDKAQAAFGWFFRAARQGHAMALNMLGRCYDLGWGTGVDRPRAAACFRAAAERGLAWGMYNYATALALGAGVAEDKAAAFDWFRKAMLSGEAGVSAKSANYLGSFYEDGWVVPRNPDEAARYYARAAAGGDFRGQFNHGRMLLAAGRIAEAQHWFTRSVATATPAFRRKAAVWLRDHGVGCV